MAHEHDQADLDWAAIGAYLEREALLRSSALRAAIGWARERICASGIDLGTVRHVTDLGCGPGVASSLLAEAFSEAEVVAVDGSPALLDLARGRAQASGVPDRVRIRVAQLPQDMPHLEQTDLIWARRVLHHLGDQQSALLRISGMLRPGGVLVLGEGGLALRFLPRSIGIGRPGLQSRLDAATEDWFTAMRAGLPDSAEIVEDWPARIAQAGLIPGGSRTFLTDHPSPLDFLVREYLHTHLTRMRHMLSERLDADDLSTIDRLLTAGDSAAILQRSDTFLLCADTVYFGHKPAEPPSGR